MYSKYWMIETEDWGVVGYEHCKRQSYEEVKEWAVQEFGQEQLGEIWSVTSWELYESGIDVY